MRFCRSRSLSPNPTSQGLWQLTCLTDLQWDELADKQTFNGAFFVACPSRDERDKRPARLISWPNEKPGFVSVLRVVPSDFPGAAPEALFFEQPLRQLLQQNFLVTPTLIPATPAALLAATRHIRPPCSHPSLSPFGVGPFEVRPGLLAVARNCSQLLAAARGRSWFLLAARTCAYVMFWICPNVGSLHACADRRLL